MFSSLDSPDRRFLSVVAVRTDGSEASVSVPFGRFPGDVWSASAPSRLLTKPTAEALRRLAQAISASTLASSPPRLDLLPARLLHSNYGASLREAAGRRDSVEVIAPTRESVVPDFVRISVSALRLHFDLGTNSVQLEDIVVATVPR